MEWNEGTDFHLGHKLARATLHILIYFSISLFLYFSISLFLYLSISLRSESRPMHPNGLNLTTDVLSPKNSFY